MNVLLTEIPEKDILLYSIVVDACGFNALNPNALVLSSSAFLFAIKSSIRCKIADVSWLYLELGNKLLSSIIAFRAWSYSPSETSLLIILSLWSAGKDSIDIVSRSCEM